MMDSDPATRAVSADAIRRMLKSQYHAALAMFREPIERCPDRLWLAEHRANAFWQIAYHALYFTHLYLQPEPSAFRPWAGHQPDVQNPDGIAGPPDPASDLPLLPRPYTRGEVLDYWRVCDRMVDRAIDRMELDSPSSGFDRYPIPKLEHQLVNLRHLQHHGAQLGDRLRADIDVGQRWVGSARETSGT
jgi:hypothetical protein